MNLEGVTGEVADRVGVTLEDTKDYARFSQFVSDCMPIARERLRKVLENNGQFQLALTATRREPLPQLPPKKTYNPSPRKSRQLGIDFDHDTY